MKFVLDNSVAMRWLFADGSPNDLNYASRILGLVPTHNVVVPVTFGLEVSNVLARAESRASLSVDQSEMFLEELRQMKFEVDGQTVERSFNETLRLAVSLKLTAYDASYLELARRRGLPLATLDEKLIKATKKAGVTRMWG